MTKNLLCTAIAVLSPLVSVSTHAAIQDADFPVNNLNADTKLRALVVTASRLEEKVDDSLASVTVLDRHDIETLQANDFRELIAHVPGIDISTSGAPGSYASLFLRGANSSHTLFLLDGQRISSATLGTTNFQFLDPSQIERIEVVRGPKSSLYGSDAIGGVIHVFTRKSQEQKNSAYVSAGFGKFNSFQTNIGGQAHHDQWRLSANVSHYRTDGFSNRADNQSINDDDDGYRNTSASAGIGYDFSDTTSLDLNHFLSAARSDYDDSMSIHPYSKNRIQSTSGLLKTQILPFWKLTFSAGRNVDDYDDYGSFPFDARTTRNSSSLQNDFTLFGSHIITVGGDYDKEKIRGNTGYANTAGSEIDDRDNKGGFVQYKGEFGILNAQLGVRHDDSDSFGSHTTENAAFGINLPENHKLIFSYGTAFHAPTFNDLYYPGFGNPLLKPERSKNYEIEVRGNYSNFSWSANIFQNDVKDLIQNVRVGANRLLPHNVAQARVRGAEIITSAKIDSWLINASLTYIDPRDEQTDNLLIYRSRRSARIDADRAFEKWSIGASLRAQDERYVDASNSAHLGGYGLVDLRGRYNISKNVDVQLKLSNIFDKRYELNNNFNTEGFGWFTAINYRM